MTQISEKQYESLVKCIYETLIANPELGIGEMGECTQEAERIVDEWMQKEGIIFSHN